MIFLLCLPIACFSKNIGVYGSIYEIAEPNLIDVIQKKILDLKKKGILQKKTKEAIEINFTRPNRVASVSNLGNKKPKTWIFDPTIIVRNNIYGSDGALVAKAGTKINPLLQMDFDETLIFLDGDNEKEMQWANIFIKSQKVNRNNIKLILTGGDVRDASAYLHEQTYFDQLGHLCKRFGIHHTPTIVTQAFSNDSGLKIPELVIREIAVG